jgi:outer membrane protein assembly factor BamD
MSWLSRRSTLALLLLALQTGVFGAWFAGCSGKEVDQNDPASLMKEAEDEIKSDHYQMAIDKLRMIKNKFPYSKYSVDAQLRMADVYFMEDSFPEAAAAYESFRDLHPKNEKVEYAMFRVGKAYYSDIPSPISRDLSSATKAQDAYNDFLKRFPTSTYAAEAKKDVEDIRRVLAEKEMYIADFYYKRDFYQSAEPRYRKIVELYPDTPSAKDAQEKLDDIAKKPKPAAEEPEKK